MAVAKALQDAGRVWIELTQETMRQGIEATESMLHCRSIGDVMHIQTEYMRNSFDSFLDKGAKMSDISMRIFAEATLPLAEQLGREGGREGEASARR